MMGSGIKGPCLDCPDRNAGCHGKAEDFKRVEVAMGYKRESRLRNAKRRTSLERRRRK